MSVATCIVLFSISFPPGTVPDGGQRSAKGRYAPQKITSSSDGVVFSHYMTCAVMCDSLCSVSIHCKNSMVIFTGYLSCTLILFSQRLALNR